METVIACIEVPVWADERRRIDMQPIAGGPTRQLSKVGITEENPFCRIIETQLIEMFMSAP